MYLTHSVKSPYCFSCWKGKLLKHKIIGCLPNEFRSVASRLFDRLTKAEKEGEREKTRTPFRHHQTGPDETIWSPAVSSVGWELVESTNNATSLRGNHIAWKKLPCGAGGALSCSREMRRFLSTTAEILRSSLSWIKPAAFA